MKRMLLGTLLLSVFPAAQVRAAFRQIAVVFGSVLLCSGLAFAQARLGPYVIDSNGLKVGHAADSSHVFMFIDGVSTFIAAGPSGFTALGGYLFLFFTDGACGTQALRNLGPTEPLVAPGFYTTDGMVHYANAVAAASADIHSSRPVNTDGSLGACGPLFISIPVAPALTASVSGFTPPFSVVDTLPVSPAPATATFNDVPTDHPFFQFIEALYASGITAGCQASPPLYCPDNPVTRGQMAVFLAKVLEL